VVTLIKSYAQELRRKREPSLGVWDTCPNQL
jgi:hypothetical protein